ncbi:MAG: potassium-transporting ATPase subunit KdpA [Actinomycetota bacterium]|jgi:K+-transporting ATPase ATPase A chain|nr:potassium-transporting ATPase subunit KdpA [Actinomycetota bacterium]
MGFFWTIVTLVVALGIAWRYLGSYMAAVFDGRVRWLGWVERPIYRALGTSPEREQSWKRYAAALLVFSAVSILFTYLMLRLQGSLPLDPQHLGAVPPALAWNTAVSFVTNTNWQNYGGETTLSYLSQMTLVVQQFVSPAVGIAVAIALVRGLTRRDASTVGNFWVDVTRCMLYILLPVAFLAGIVYVGQGGVQTLAGPAHVHDALNGVTQTIARGPIAFMEAIKQLGTNGGGFLNANSATPFENPTALTNWLSIFLLLCIPFSLTYTFGKMAGSRRQGAALLTAMALIFGAWVGFTSYAEHQANPAVAAAGLPHQPTGNMEGKEVRFGDTSSALFGVASTQTSTGSADAAYDSFTPMGGFGLITGMMLGEVSPGGTGSGLYTILLFAIVAVFIGGLMIGRTPEYLGKKIQAHEVKLAGLGILIMPIAVLALTAVAVSVHAGRAGPLNAGPHGFSEILYAFTSQANNNGSAFAGLSGDTAFYNVLGGIAMLLGRFAVIVPVLALAGALGAKNVVPAGLGTFRTDNAMFVGLVIGAIMLVGALTFFPAISLGPIVEQLSHGRFF